MNNIVHRFFLNTFYISYYKHFIAQKPFDKKLFLFYSWVCLNTFQVTTAKYSAEFLKLNISAK